MHTQHTYRTHTQSLRSWTRLAATVLPGVTVIFLEQQVDWPVGSRCVRVRVCGVRCVSGVVVQVLLTTLSIITTTTSTT